MKMRIMGNDGFLIERSLKMRYIVTYGLHNDVQQMTSKTDTFIDARDIAAKQASYMNSPYTTKVYEIRPHVRPVLLAEYLAPVKVDK